jgi:hypothetical protein
VHYCRVIADPYYRNDPQEFSGLDPLHDFKHLTMFVTDDEPVLCASCRRSNALAEVGGPGGIEEVANVSVARCIQQDRNAMTAMARTIWAPAFPVYRLIVC